MGDRILYLVRHGQLDMQAYAADHFAAGLTTDGREQARCTARRLRTLPVTSICSSTLGRARETADIIAAEFPGLVVRPSRLLWELPNLGPPDDPAWRRVFARGKERGERAFRKFVRPSARKREVSILVSHGNLIRYFVCRVLGIAPESWSALGTSHCGVTELAVQGAVVRVIGYNDTHHLPARLHGPASPSRNPRRT